ncbi:hypothetical protein BRADI_3g02708v3 [Brachypodium distachyon]|uniref:Uncharacterized protein n=1 Tax=Brachypodium distachyon TaxID=15368 RepID=A0A2K2CUT6_BRADI|nr:hypothetical protein BRADI_3g02708v3 [Brachypodium distachyon]
MYAVSAWPHSCFDLVDHTCMICSINRLVNY